jgi:radical SAM family uncharacterized protein/radical SAM-linked protein
MRDILRLLPKPSRYAGGEWGAVVKDPGQVSVRLALAFPDLYEVGMSYLGQKILGEAVNRRPEFWAERVFAPCREAAAILTAQKAPLTTLESDTPLGDLDVLAFHLTHELCYTNVLYMLDLAGLPLWAKDRGPSHPLVLAGGGCAFNAEPLAPFLDALVLGDGEEVLPRILEQVQAAKTEGRSRQELLLSLKDLPGVYVPEFFSQGKSLLPGLDHVEKALVADLDQAPFPVLTAVSCGQAVHDRLSLEIARGCTRGCRFCQAGMIYRPVRERSLGELAKLADKALSLSGYEEMSFLSLSTGDFSALESLFTQSSQRCLADQVAISLSSLRAGTITPTMLALMSRLRRTGATMAPEAGSARLRAVINKGITQEDILGQASRLFRAGWQSMKLYFMIGLPTETDQDLEAIADLAMKVLAQAPRGTKRLQVTVALSTFVPKPHTPFQWEGQIGQAETKRRIGLIRDRLGAQRKIVIKWHEPAMSWLEGVFSRGDRGLAPVVERAYRRGATFSSWVDLLDLEPWYEAFEECGIKADDYLGPRGLAGPLPWDHLRCGVSKAYLLQERERALGEKATPDCRYGACLQCGACSEMCREPQIGAPGVKPRVNLAVPQWQAAQATEPEEQAIQDNSQRREELGYKAGHYRVWFSKTGPAAFLSQLELQNVLERSLRRSGLKPAFSSGFHPMPLVAFGWALPVGVESLAEWFALFLREPSPPAELARRLGQAMPEGLNVLGAEELGMGRKVEQPKAEEFRLRFLEGEPDPAGRMAQWQELLGRENYPWVSATKRGTRSLNLRPLVQAMEQRGPAEVVLTFSWANNQYLSPLKLVMAINQGLSQQDFLLTKLRQIF